MVCALALFAPRTTDCAESIPPLRLYMDEYRWSPGFSTFLREAISSTDGVVLAGAARHMGEEGLTRLGDFDVLFSTGSVGRLLRRPRCAARRVTSLWR